MSTEAEITSSSRYSSGQALEVTQIERELQRLWKDAGESSTKSGGGPVVRACSMTLVAACSNDIQFDHVAKVMEQTAFKQPCRAILARVDMEQQSAAIDASVSTVCSLGAPGQRRVCHEQIQMFATAGSLISLAPSVLSLLVPDVPAYLWAPCEKLLGTELLSELSSHADALLLDSHRFSDPFRALERAVAIARDHRANRALRRAGLSRDAGHGFGVLDLEWIRLQAWFDATAAAFDLPGAGNVIQDIRSLRIEYIAKHPAGALPGSSVAFLPRETVTPALYAGWFASRLGWGADSERPRSNGSEIEYLMDSGGDRIITIAPSYVHDRPGSIIRVEITHGTGRIVLEKNPGVEEGRIAVESRGFAAAPKTLTYRFSTIDDTEALSRALSRAPRDPRFEKAIPTALAFHLDH